MHENDRTPALPSNKTESFMLGYTGEQCEACGQMTLVVEKNKLYEFLSCKWCGHRYDSKLLATAKR